MNNDAAQQNNIRQDADDNQPTTQLRQLNELLTAGLAAALPSDNHSQLFHQVFSAIGKKIAFDAIFILQQNCEQVDVQPLASLPQLPFAKSMAFPQNHQLFRQHLNLSNLALLDWWHQLLLPSSYGYQSALTYPIHTPQSAYVLVLLSNRVAAFSAKSVTFLRAFTPSLASTLSQLEKRRFQEERDKLRAQQHRIEQSLLRQEKMAAIGQLAAGVAHELNNPLGFIYCNLNTLQHYLQQIDSYIQQSLQQYPALAEIATRLQLQYIRQESSDLINESLAGARRARDIINNLRTFSHPDEKTLHDLDFCSLLNDTVRIAQTQVKHSAKLLLDIPEQPAFLRGNATQLSQVLLNLLTNASQAIIAGKGEIRIQLQQQGEFWHLLICDNGCGIPEQTINHIFEPFFTTKPIGLGTGLGLSLSRAIAEQHGGSLTLASTSETGSCFELRLPVLAVS